MEAHQHLQQLLPLFHHSPMAMAEVNVQGIIRRVNPKAVQLMMPMAMHLGLPGNNLLDTLAGYLPSLLPIIADFNPLSGVIIDQEPYIIRFEMEKTLIQRHFSLTIEKIGPESLLLFFQDVTDFLIKADALRERL